MKKFLTLLLACVIMIGLFPTNAMAKNEISVLLNGGKLEFDVPPQLINDRTMVPMRKIFEAMGAVVQWDDATQTVTATKKELVVVMQINSKVMSVKNQKITLDVPPMLIDSRTLVPVRAVAESFNALVGWDDIAQTVIITELRYVHAGNLKNTQTNSVGAKGPAFSGGVCKTVNSISKMPSDYISSFDTTQKVHVAGKLTGVSKRQDLMIQWQYPSGMSYNSVLSSVGNNETIDIELCASYIGTGTNGKVSIILRETGEVLATYYFSISQSREEEELETEEVSQDEGGGASSSGEEIVEDVQQEVNDKDDDEDDDEDDEDDDIVF